MKENHSRRLCISYGALAKITESVLIAATAVTTEDGKRVFTPVSPEMAFDGIADLIADLLRANLVIEGRPEILAVPEGPLGEMIRAGQRMTRDFYAK